MFSKELVDVCDEACIYHGCRNSKDYHHTLLRLDLRVFLLVRIHFCFTCAVDCREVYIRPPWMRIPTRSRHCRVSCFYWPSRLLLSFGTALSREKNEDRYRRSVEWYSTASNDWSRFWKGRQRPSRITSRRSNALIAST